jgi:hypothetical protein
MDQVQEGYPLRIEEVLGHDYAIENWKQINRNLFSALRLEKTVMFIILALIVLVAAFNIAGSLVMMVMEKRKDIAILKAMGATARSIGRIFVIKGLMIGLVGTMLGTSAGIGIVHPLKAVFFYSPPGRYILYQYVTCKFEIIGRPVDCAVCAVHLLCRNALSGPSGGRHRSGGGHPSWIMETGRQTGCSRDHDRHPWSKSADSGSGISKIYNHSGARIVVLNQLAFKLDPGKR